MTPADPDTTAADLAYWRSVLADPPEPLELPGANGSAVPTGWRCARTATRLAPATAQRVAALARETGATPYMAVNPLVDGATVRMVAGLSVPMLWRTLSQPDLPLDELVERAMLGGRNGLAASAFTPPQHQYRRSLPDDLQNRHDQ